MTVSLRTSYKHKCTSSGLSDVSPFSFVSVIFLGYYNKNALSGRLINSRHLFLMVLKTGNKDQGASMVTFWWQPPSRLQIADFPLYSHTVDWREESKLSCGLMVIPVLGPYLILIVPYLQTLWHWMSEFQHINFEEQQHTVHKSVINVFKKDAIGCNVPHRMSW